MHVPLWLLPLLVRLASQSIARPSPSNIDHLYWCKDPTLESPTINTEVHRGICVADDCSAIVTSMWYYYKCARCERWTSMGPNKPYCKDHDDLPWPSQFLS
ncbi:hypothetical protein PCANC_16347 [Puccinia coronata f. sp. avenae]|uniref:Secreted protein n=1 Tax=Puccinia coronata f. sp. avenae TaxID=200324 RepID=A0A2N5UQP7_9BASI|nr:hypothetical protein PCASD_22160 [Puccinia coronata f. sp. avenae]PLW40081.1 hypothetical protein PCANC_16347 [Puccinia coronata f. sp. avenae]PLW46661.1 hypothetical protein PCASD_03708 [Puccinia coronata f. sp. avenae]